MMVLLIRPLVPRPAQRPFLFVAPGALPLRGPWPLLLPAAPGPSAALSPLRLQNFKQIDVGCRDSTADGCRSGL